MWGLFFGHCKMCHLSPKLSALPWKRPTFCRVSTDRDYGSFPCDLGKILPAAFRVFFHLVEKITLHGCTGAAVSTTKEGAMIFKSPRSLQCCLATCSSPRSSKLGSSISSKPVSKTENFNTIQAKECSEKISIFWKFFTSVSFFSACARFAYFWTSNVSQTGWFGERRFFLVLNNNCHSDWNFTASIAFSFLFIAVVNQCHSCGLSFCPRHQNVGEKRNHKP